ncbi:hypothetical protein NHX12_033795 [Muraenolepis orangiensis]|uniref:Cystinosin n=1 Tax=Muraenolepis orangiensis TaxID=630683 RepID=A0A9Q0E428_9TELE|nr:hypothetical protein NHX12_033795 [Muraenolepis orangiensis]
MVNINSEYGTTVSLTAPDLVTLEQNSETNVTITSSAPINQSAEIQFNVSFSSKLNSTIITLPQQVLLQQGSSSVTFEVKAHSIGQVTVYLESNSSEILSSSTRIRFAVVSSNTLTIINEVIGWIYFVAWSVSFYPQVWENWRGKSVVGLNFDFLSLNITGFICYSIFNVGLFWVPYIKEEFLKVNRNGVNPVDANDVFFSLHAVLLCLVYICQAAVYERGGQTVSRISWIILIFCWLFILVGLFVALGGVLPWLSYLYFFSYVKLGITVIKYTPQAYMNYRRKSTGGWSIGNVLLDFVGGTFSILQMLMKSYNNDMWGLILGDPTKFLLGLVSILFDILFMVQHYCLYRPTRHYKAVGDQE